MDSFDASKVAPQQGIGKHPCGRFPFTITNTFAKENKDKTGAMLVVELSSDVGRIENRYNIWNNSAAAVDIAQKELSALCHAVNIFRITFPRNAQGQYDMGNAARELRGGRGIMEVAYQKGEEPTAERPDGGYVEVRKVFDSAGNEPGKQGSAPQPQQVQHQQPQQGQAPMQQQPGGGWGQPQPNQNPAPQGNPNPAPQGWGGQQQPPSNTPPQQQSQGGNGWQPGGNTPQGNTPPWGAPK